MRQASACIMAVGLFVCHVGMGAEPPAPDAFVAFKGVNVLPMTSEHVLRKQTVLVSEGIVIAVGDEDHISVPKGARVVEGRGRYLMPGLAEMHAHIPGPEPRQYLDDVLFLFVANGVTLARGMLGAPEHLQLRTDLAAHRLLGPRLYTSGPSLNGGTVKSPEEGAAMVREQQRAGYDFIKLHPGLSRESFLSIARTAHEVGIPFGGHVSQDVGLAFALANGQATVDHLDGYVLAVSTSAGEPGMHPDNVGLALKFDPTRVSDIVKATRAAGTWVVPTQVLSETSMIRQTPAELDSRPEMSFVPTHLRAQYRAQKQSVLDIKALTPELADKFIEVRRTIIRNLFEGQAGLLLGSDAPQLFSVPGFSVHRELRAMVDAGLSPYQALRMGTAAPAEFLRQSGRFGTITVGADADLILVEANPLIDIGNSQQISGVMVRGRWLDRSFLDRGLADIRARNGSGARSE